MSIYLLACLDEADERVEEVVACDVIIVSSLVVREVIPRVASRAVSRQRGLSCS